MLNFLLDLEYNLETTLWAVLISFVLTAVLVWAIVAAVKRSQLAQLRTKLEKEITDSEQQRMQLATDLNLLQQKIQQLEKEKQAAQIEAEQVLVLESSIEQQKQKLAELSQRLGEAEKSQAELQQEQQEKDAAMKQQVTHIVELEQNLHKQQTLAQHYDAMINAEINKQECHPSVVPQKKNAIPEDSTLRRHYLALVRTNIEKNKAPRPTDSTLRRHYDAMIAAEIEKHLACDSEKPAQQSTLMQVEKPLGVLDLQQAGIKLRESYQALEKKLADSKSVVKELQHALATAQHQLKVVTEHSSHHATAITELNTTLAEQANHISRLEYDLELKKSIIKDHHYPEQEIPAAILAKQEEAQARIAELEQLLDAKEKSPTVDLELQLAQIAPSEDYQALEKKLADNEELIKQLQAALTNAQAPITPVVTNSDLTKKLMDQATAIAELNAAQVEQANYLLRLEYDLEVKKAVISDQHTPLQGIPAAIVAKQEEDQARIAELEQLLNSKQKVTLKTAEKTQSTVPESATLAKQKIEEMTDVAKHLPEQFKSLYQKILAKKP